MLAHFVVVQFSPRSSIALVGLDLVVGFLCVAQCPIFHGFFHFDPRAVTLHIISCRRFSLFRLEKFINPFWSSYGSVGFVLCVEFRFHSACTTHLLSGSDAILIANLHFILLWVLIQHWIFVVSICSMASSVLLFMYSIQSSSSITAVSISSSVTFMKEMSLSSSQLVFELCPSSVASSELPWFSSSLPSFIFLSLSISSFALFSSLLWVFFCIFFSFVWWGGAFCAASVGSFFRVLLWESMYHMRSLSLERRPCRISDGDADERTILRSALVCICRTSPKQP